MDSHPCLDPVCPAEVTRGWVGYTDGARRETAEEANANVEGLAPYTHLDIPAIAQTYILFR